jgi:hypothetical protein
LSKSLDGWLPIPAKVDDLKPPYDGEEYILARFIWWNGKDDNGVRHGPAQWIFDWASDANWLSTSVHAHWNLDYPSEHRLVTAPPTHYREIGLPGTKRAAVRAVRRRRATRDDDIPF